jgi:CheY-like chemotaxis protein
MAWLFPQNFKKMKILIADDSLHFRIILKKTLSKIRGIEIINEAEDYVSTINHLEENSYDFLILDIRLPDESGFHVLDYIKEMKNKPIVYVVTDYAIENNKIKALEKGASEIFDKAHDIDKLTKKIMNAEKNNPNRKDSFRGKNILLVEDDEINTYYFLEVLKTTRARLIYARNGKEAIEKVNILPQIDIILMDLKMPEMDGFETHDEIRKMNQKIPIIAQTAYAMENDKNKVLSYGFDGYLTKPIDQNELFTILELFLGDKKAADEIN